MNIPNTSFSSLKNFINELSRIMPHVENGKVVNPTPIIDLTELIAECARREYKINIDAKKIKVYGKLESKLPAGSVKTRPAYYILKNAIENGLLKEDTIVFEATSGNFGISLSLLTKLGIKVVAIVSRKLQEGVLEELSKSGVKIIDLDIDICPAPGLKVSLDVLSAKLAYDKIKESLEEIGLDIMKLARFENEIESLLIKQDVINLAKLLAKIHNGFCPKQYDNECNPKVHEEITAREIEQQLNELGEDINEFTIVCTFGTGGTATGLSNYFLKTLHLKKVRVIYPLSAQDVAGIRTKEKALGLRFYKPELYLGEHEVDFEEAKKLLIFFNERGVSIGESSALALYATIQMINFGLGNKFLVILPDDFEKYSKKYEIRTIKLSVSYDEVKDRINEYEAIIWTHGAFIPNEEAIELISKQFNIDKRKIEIANREEMIQLTLKSQIPDRIKSKKKILLMCVGGGTSLKIAEFLFKNGIIAQSLEGGIIPLTSKIGKKVEELLKPFSKN